MKKNIDGLTQRSEPIRIALVTLGILLFPLLGRWPWSIFDYLLMGTLIFGTGMILDWVSRKVSKNYRVLAIIAVLFTFFIIWAELAVGLVSQLLAGEL